MKTIDRIMGMTDDYAYNKAEAMRLEYETWRKLSFVKQANADVDTSRQALQDELTKLLTPLNEDV